MRNEFLKLSLSVTVKLFSRTSHSNTSTYICSITASVRMESSIKAARQLSLNHSIVHYVTLILPEDFCRQS